MEALMNILPVLLPVIILNLLLAIIALVHVLRHKNYRCGNQPLWVAVVLFIQIIGPVLYFAIGRGEEK